MPRLAYGGLALAMDVDSRFTICALFFGNYPDLAKRCLGSIVAAVAESQKATGRRVRLSLGANTVCDETRRYLEAHVSAGWVAPRDLRISDVNIHKYPMMRQMFHDSEAPLTSEFVMWFDDDSWIDSPWYGNRLWLDEVYAAATTADMIGAIYTRPVVGNQPQWLETQPWYRQKPIVRGQRVRFITGGWWVLRTKIVHAHDWPIRELDHCGGDMMLGDLCRQQDYLMKQFDRGVRINADDAGRQSRSPRRGFTSPLIGENYRPASAAPAKFLDLG